MATQKHHGRPRLLRLMKGKHRRAGLKKNCTFAAEVRNGRERGIGASVSNDTQHACFLWPSPLFFVVVGYHSATCETAVVLIYFSFDRPFPTLLPLVLCLHYFHFLLQHSHICTFACRCLGCLWAHTQQLLRFQHLLNNAPRLDSSAERATPRHLPSQALA